MNKLINGLKKKNIPDTSAMITKVRLGDSNADDEKTKE